MASPKTFSIKESETELKKLIKQVWFVYQKQ